VVPGRPGRPPGLTHPAGVPPAANVFWLYPFLADTRAGRDGRAAGLERAGVGTRPFFRPARHFPVYPGGGPAAAGAGGGPRLREFRVPVYR
jgi:hypothetical protein